LALQTIDFETLNIISFKSLVIALLFPCNLCDW